MKSSRASLGTCLLEFEGMAVAMSIRLLIFVLVWPLLSASVFAGDRGANFTQEANQPADFHLSGILISPKGRSALINNEIAREGDHVAGAKVLSIGTGEVRILMGARQATVRVGSTAVWTNDIDESYGPVRRGETLSEIAERHLVKDITLNQLMIALFEANPAAFDNNINYLREGATLRIPAEDAFRRLAATNAASEVERHMNVWRPGDAGPERPARVAGTVEPATYGPVSHGETLSGIAARLPRNGATLSQTITALFHANTEAFGGNMNILREGAVLRIPEMLNRQSPEMATAEVEQHANVWRRRTTRLTQVAWANRPLNLPIIDPGVLTGGIILSMNSSE